MREHAGLRLRKSIMGTKFAQINLARSFGGIHELMDIIDKWSLDVVLIQEPYQRKTSWPGFRAYSVYELSLIHICTVLELVQRPMTICQ